MSEQPYGGGICPVHNKPYMPIGFPDKLPEIGAIIRGWACPECVKQAAIDVSVQHSFDRDAVRDVIVALGHALTDGHADPAENLEAEALTSKLADLLGNVSGRIAAEAVQVALNNLHTDWMGNPNGF